jgi:hypothetical protein
MLIPPNRNKLIRFGSASRKPQSRASQASFCQGFTRTKLMLTCGMSIDAVLLEHHALRLPLQERALLADRLLQSLGREDDAALKHMAEVADARWTAYQYGEIQTVDGAAALQRLRAGLRQTHPSVPSRP